MRVFRGPNWWKTAQSISIVDEERSRPLIRIWGEVQIWEFWKSSHFFYPFSFSLKLFLYQSLPNPKLFIFFYNLLHRFVYFHSFLLLFLSARPANCCDFLGLRLRSSLGLNSISIRIYAMSAAMDNLLKMFKTARETAGESSGTAPSAADVEALLVHFAVLIAEDDDPRYVSWGHLEENAWLRRRSQDGERNLNSSPGWKFVLPTRKKGLIIFVRVDSPSIRSFSCWD